MVTEHNRLTIVTDTDPPPMPTFACGFHPHFFHLYPSAFHEDLSLRRCHSVLVLNADHIKDGRNRDIIGLAVPEGCRGFPFTCCQNGANKRASCRKRGGSSSSERFQSTLVCFLVAQQRQHTADSFEERRAGKVEKGRTGVLVSEQRCHRVHGATVWGCSCAGASTF